MKNNALSASLPLLLIDAKILLIKKRIFVISVTIFRKALYLKWEFLRKFALYLHVKPSRPRSGTTPPLIKQIVCVINAIIYKEKTILSLERSEKCVLLTPVKPRLPAFGAKISLIKKTYALNVTILSCQTTFTRRWHKSPSDEKKDLFQKRYLASKKLMSKKLKCIKQITVSGFLIAALYI
jgi:hypothetical protein